MTVLSPFDEVIRDFATAQHLSRIKKLLVYACTQQWESDIDRLAQFHLHDLIQTLMKLAPTFDQLQPYLHQVTQSLSKPAEYLLIANTIMQHLRPLYVGPISSPSFQASSHLYWQIAQVLEQESEYLRIRKLLVLVCRNYWEADRDRLLAIDLPELLAELHHLTQSIENLNAVMTSVVQTTSKPAQYQAIADRIIHACQGFYTATPSVETQLRSIADSASSHPTPAHPDEYTQHESMSDACHADNASSMVSSGEHGAIAEQGYGENADAGDRDAGDRDAGDRGAGDRGAGDRDAGDRDAGDRGAGDRGDRRLYAQPIPSFSKADLYDLRLEIMKYAVPLLAKHLLFLIVYTPPGQASEQEQAEFAADVDAWMTLKNRDLDDLIEASLKHYPTLDDLNAALQLTVRSLPTSQRYMPVTTAIVRAVRTLMTKSTFARPDLLDTANQKPGHRHAMSDFDKEGTRQVFASTETFQEKSTGQPLPLASSHPSANVESSALTPGTAHLTDRPASSSAETACLPPPDVPPPSHDKQTDNCSTENQPDENADHAPCRTGQRQPTSLGNSKHSNSTDETAFLT